METDKHHHIILLCTRCSLVPRPSPAPVFNRLQYAKTEPEASTKRKISLLCSTAIHIRHDEMFRPCCESHGKIHQAFWLRFCILQAIKNWSRGRPGNEAILDACSTKSNYDIHVLGNWQHPSKLVWHNFMQNFSYWFALFLGDFIQVSWNGTCLNS